MENKVERSSDIVCRIGLDKNNVPVKIDWKAQDSPDTPEFKECKAILLSMFDKEFQDTFKIDLWTSELQVGEMDKFMYQTLRGLADSYHRATNNTKLANEMQRFVQHFGETTELIPKEESK